MLILPACNTYIPDPIDPRLPKYTENGNNVAGALVDDDNWRSEAGSGLFDNKYWPMILLDAASDSLHIVFHGSSSRYQAIEFDISDQGIESFSDLVLLNDRKISLDGVMNSASCREFPCMTNATNCERMAGVGQLHIRKVLMESAHEAVLSGTFGFTATHPTHGHIKVSYGRFDFRFSNGLNFIVQ